ncbi:hypothetical protein AC1031_008774 [Aphanomyces cochlioides]|nr:hypothetical protein AC1031_008774 [Aphanomyces cochlioides]
MSPRERSPPTVEFDLKLPKLKFPKLPNMRGFHVIVRASRLSITTMQGEIRTWECDLADWRDLLSDGQLKILASEFAVPSWAITSEGLTQLQKALKQQNWGKSRRIRSQQVDFNINGVPTLTLTIKRPTMAEPIRVMFMMEEVTKPRQAPKEDPKPRTSKFTQEKGETPKPQASKSFKKAAEEFLATPEGKCTVVTAVGLVACALVPPPVKVGVFAATTLVNLLIMMNETHWHCNEARTIKN